MPEEPFPPDGTDDGLAWDKGGLTCECGVAPP
jgi:hypothetical protein